MSPSKKSLNEFVEEIAGTGKARIAEDLGHGFVRLEITEAEKRQAKDDIRSTEAALRELLRNARDAGATQVFIATHSSENIRHLSVIDNGSGVVPDLKTTIFEPRVTSKLDTVSYDLWGLHGRGMALYSIAQNALKAELAHSEVGRGSAVRAQFDCNVISEKTDQSTWPEVANDQVVSGPHNLIRLAVEFALDSPQIEVYFGSPAEIVATMLEIAQAEQSSGDWLDLKHQHKPLYTEIGFINSADELVNFAGKLGIELSERTARRIIDLEIAALPQVTAAIWHKHKPESLTSHLSKPSSERQLNRSIKSSGLKISAADGTEFISSIKTGIDQLCHKYYVKLAKAPKLTVRDNTINLKLTVCDDD